MPRRALGACAFALLAALASQRTASAGTPGIDGAKTITAANTVVNGYASIATATAGTRTITVASVAGLSPAGLTPLGAGSVLLLYQANGATIDSTDTATYGNVTALNNAGYFEFVTVGSVSGNTITLSSQCNTLAHTYTTSGSTGALEAEAVRVPQYSSLTINAGASITATPWSASEITTPGSANYGLSTAAVGGIVAIDVNGTTTINGSINVTGDGFLGGDGYMNAGDSAPGTHAQPITDTVFSGETGGDLQTALAAMKGESIAGNQATYDLNFVSRYGRGAPANGGGGGNGHNNGGGGGANGNNGNTWYGVGLQDTAYTAYYSNSNGKNPLGTYDNGGYSANGVALAGTPMSIDSGGGRGGYSFGVAGGVVVPTNEGGLGGRPLNAVANSRVFFGGGGGAGDENNGSGGYGGNGGGIVILNTGTVTGAGSIVANGNAGGTPSNSDAAGGGGGGGSVVVLAGGGTVASISANGGAGGNAGANTGGTDTEGTGGGGGGGFVAAPASAISVAGGSEGLEQAPSPQATADVPYGATLGANGSATGAPASFTYCYTAVIGAAKSATVVNNGDGTYNVTYTVLVQNYGDTPLSTVQVQDVLANTFTTGAYSIVTQPTTPVVTGGATATAGTNYDGTAATYVISAGTLPIGGATPSTITTTFTVKIKPPPGSQTYNNTATAAALGTTGNASGASTTDSSENGANPDPAGNGNPQAENVVTPVTIVGQPPLAKTVQNITTGEATGLTSDKAVPGNVLKYTLSFTNDTGGPLTVFSVKDVIPANTTYYATTPAACASFPAGMTCTAVYTPPAGANAGYVTFTLSGTATGQTTPGLPSTTTVSPAQLILTFEVTVN